MKTKTLTGLALGSLLFFSGCSLTKANVRQDSKQDYEFYASYPFGNRQIDLYHSEKKGKDYFDYNENDVNDLEEIASFMKTSNEINFVELEEGVITKEYCFIFEVDHPLFSNVVAFYSEIYKGKPSKEYENIYPGLMLGVNIQGLGDVLFFDFEIDGLQKDEDKIYLLRPDSKEIIIEIDPFQDEESEKTTKGTYVSLVEICLESIKSN